MSTDRRSKRDEVRISKSEYIRGYAISIPTSITQTSQKRRLCWERPEQRINSWQPSKWFTPVQWKKFTKLWLKQNLHAPVAMFVKYKPFYITAPTEREKELCLHKKCLNTHLLLAGISNIRKAQKLPRHLSINDFLNEKNSHDHRIK